MTIALLSLAVLLVCIGLVVYPYVIYPFTLRFLPEVPFEEPDGDGAPSFALLFCAHNEERALPEVIANLRRLKQRWPSLDLHAYSDNSSDRTFELLAEAGDIIDAVEGTERAGKPLGMKRLVDRSTADVLIFMDANVIIDVDTARNFERYFSHPDVGAVSCTLHYVNEDESATASVGGLYWRIEERIKRLETRTGSIMGADGSLFALRRNLYPEVRPDLQDDFLGSMQAVFAGLRCVSAPDILAYERGAVDPAAEFKRKRRIACGAFSTHRAMLPQLRRMSRTDRFKYVSHKLVRWFGAPIMVIGAIAALVFAASIGMLVPALFLGAFVLATIGFAMRAKATPVLKLYEIGAAMVATALGVWESIRGVRYATWTPPER